MEVSAPFLVYKKYNDKPVLIELEKQYESGNSSVLSAYSVPPQAGRGMIHCAELSCSTRAFIINARFTEDVRIEFMCKTEAVSLCINYHTGNSSLKAPELAAGECLISYHPSDYYNCEFKSGNYNSLVYLHPSPDFLAGLVSDPYLVKLLNLEEIINRQASKAYNFRVCSSPMTKVLTDKIINSPYPGLVKNVFIETAIMEITALHITSLDRESFAVNKSSFLKKNDFERITVARDILVGRMINPPSVSDLASEAGINEFKLKKGFREVYGMTVYEYLRRVRLDHARYLLSYTGKTVTEVALETGYSNPSHFAHLFKKNFGVSPKEFSSGISNLQKNCF